MWLLTFAACETDPQAVRPQDGVDVLAYDVSLTVSPDTPAGGGSGRMALAGTARLRVRHTPDTETLVLRFEEPEQLKALRVNDVSVEAVREGDLLRVPLTPSGNAADTLSVVEIGYVVLDRRDDGLYVEEARGQTVTLTDSQFLRGASWLPAVHHPADPATLRLTVTAPDSLEVVASGALVTDTLVAGASDGVPRGWRRWTYTVDAAVPVYTFAFAVADFATTEQSATLPSGATIPIQHHLLGSDTTDARWLVRTPETLAYFDSTLGPYAFDTYATAQVPIPFAGMENAATSFLRYDLYGQTYRGQNIAEEVNVHEVAHMWFGNRVTIRDYADLWLSEGIVSYLTTLFYEAADGPATARRLRVRMAEFETSNDLFDARQPLVPDALADPMDLVGATVYLKGGCVTHLLRLTLGDNAFFRALRRTYAAYGLVQRPLSTVAFQTLLEDESGQDLDAFFAYWVYGDQVPTLNARWDDSTGRLTWTVEDDEGLLADLPIELEITQEGTTAYVPLAAGQTTLAGTRLPSIRPVGVPMRVR